jgi:tRNA-2-methylthio-N6-dimethylallyladenosine synthase
MTNYKIPHTNYLKYYIWTIGCQMNKAESERLGGLFEKAGYQPVTSVEDADLILLNSCVVRQNAEQKVINKLTNLKALKRSRPGMILAVTGCIVDSDYEHLKKRFPQVDYFFKAGDLPPWLATPEQPLLPLRPSVSTYVSIMQGCNNFCSYCIVPYRRGRERSRPLSEIVCEVEELARRGVKEVVLLGQNVDSYGQDLPDRPDLADLLEKINNIQGLARIRFLTNHPKDMSLKLIDTMAKLDKVCEQLSLPVQAGDNGILKLMRRGYTVEHYRDLAKLIREKVSGVALSTDVIVGFPSETEEQFTNTYKILAELKFDNVHIAAYSPRDGTYAARELKDDVPLPEKARRQALVERLEEETATEINAKLLGKTVEVLVEGQKAGKWQGRTRTDKLVFFKSKENCIGRLIRVNIERTSPWSLQGKEEK